jgi:hypothetical protein
LITYNAEIDYNAMDIPIYIPPNIYTRITEKEYKKLLITIYGWSFVNIYNELKEIYYQPVTYFQEV